MCEGEQVKLTQRVEEKMAITMTKRIRRKEKKKSSGNKTRRK